MEYTTLDAKQHQMTLSGHTPLTLEQENLLAEMNSFNNFIADVEVVDLPF